jgi:hypothetical protein
MPFSSIPQAASGQIFLLEERLNAEFPQSHAPLPAHPLRRSREIMIVTASPTTAMMLPQRIQMLWLIMKLDAG